MNDVDEEIDRVYELIAAAMRPVLKRIDPLLFDLTMALGDSQRLHYSGLHDILAGIMRDWAKQIVNPFGMDAPKVIAQQIVQIVFDGDPPPHFWRTELGQRLFEVDGFPERGATQAEAAVILDMTQQGVSAAIRRGRLRPDKADPKHVARSALIRYASIRRRRLALDRETRAAVAGELT